MNSDMTVDHHSTTNIGPITITNRDASDREDLSEQVQKIFVDHPHLHRRKLHCRSVENRVVIEGEVHSFFEKQLAQEALRTLDGLAVENRINVVER